MKNSIGRFRLISFVEGLSYLFLLFIAMPVKYLLQEPILVKYTGMAHGVLFLLFIVFLVEFQSKHSQPFSTFAKMFLLSSVPFGFIWIDKKLKSLQ